MNRSAASSLLKAEGASEEAVNKPTPEQLAEAEQVFNKLRVELEKLVRARVRFRRDLRKAVAEGEKMLEELLPR